MQVKIVEKVFENERQKTTALWILPKIVKQHCARRSPGPGVTAATTAIKLDDEGAVAVGKVERDGFVQDIFGHEERLGVLNLRKPEEFP